MDPATFTETGQPIPRTVFERIACDSEVTRIVFGPDSEPLDVGRTQRTVTPAQCRAVIARDRTCRGPGLPRTPTALRGPPPDLVDPRRGRPPSTNSGLFCWRCHDWIHAEDITITHHAGTWTFTHPDGRTTIRGPDQLTA